MEVESGLRRWLADRSEVTSYTGQRLWRHRLMEPVDGAGTRALVIRRQGSWATQETLQTVERPVVVVECWADCTRDSSGHPTRDDAADNAWALARVVDSLLHRQRNATWGAVPVADCRRYGSPTLWIAADLDDVNDAACVMTRWAVEVVPTGALPSV